MSVSPAHTAPTITEQQTGIGRAHHNYPRHLKMVCLPRFSVQDGLARQKKSCYRRRTKSELQETLSMPVDATLEKPLPNNLDAERSVLGAILLDNNALNPAIEHLRPEAFFLDQHRPGFTPVIALGVVQQAIDLVTLT